MRGPESRCLFVFRPSNITSHPFGEKQLRLGDLLCFASEPSEIFLLHVQRGGRSTFHRIQAVADKTKMPASENNAATARKRRKEIMQTLRAENAKTAETEDALPPKKRKVASKAKAVEEPEEDEEAPTVSTEATTVATVAAIKTTTEDAKKKTQIRYDPQTPMNKEQLAAWRREARRVRNRESAAASRQRIRDRITELEEEVSDWKTKYEEAQLRLAAMESGS